MTKYVSYNFSKIYNNLIINTILKFNIMKTPNYLKRLKTLVFMTCLLSIGIVSAQQTTGDITKEADIIPGTTTTGGSVRVIDNKGTIRYLQSNNGITMLSNTTADVTTTTWQLGGTLIDSTFIDVDAAAFGLDGIKLVDINTENASTDATSQSSHDDATSGTGYTILVRDENTGETKKLLATDLLQSGQESFTATAAQVSYPLTGSPVLPTFSQVWVYRNGAKLIANVDYTIAASTITLAPGGTAPNDWAVFAGDIIEVQYVK